MRRAHIRHLVRFGGSYTGLDVIAAILSNADYFVVGLVLGATQLGLYTLGDFPGPGGSVVDFTFVRR